MQRKKKNKQVYRIGQAGFAFALLLLLCGCTRKEELLILTEETAEDMSASRNAGGETSGAGDSGYVTETETVGALAGENGRVSSGESRHVTTGEGQRPGALSGDGAVETDAAAADFGVIYVHVCGAVKNPGVYELETGSRVYEAVQQAGGFTENAEQNYVNQAQALEDGVKLVIPTREEAKAAGEHEMASAEGKPQEGAPEKSGILQDGTTEGFGILGGSSLGGQSPGESKATGTAADGRININTASKEQLCEIPGVGATRAAAIAAYRESHGAFEKPEDIMKVNGIKEGMYEKIKDSISVN